MRSINKSHWVRDSLCLFDFRLTLRRSLLETFRLWKKTREIEIIKKNSNEFVEMVDFPSTIEVCL